VVNHDSISVTFTLTFDLESYFSYRLDNKNCLQLKKLLPDFDEMLRSRRPKHGLSQNHQLIIIN